MAKSDLEGDFLRTIGRGLNVIAMWVLAALAAAALIGGGLVWLLLRWI